MSDFKIIEVPVTREQLCKAVWDASEPLSAREAALVMSWASTAETALTGSFHRGEYECPACAAGIWPPTRADDEGSRARSNSFAHNFDDEARKLLPEDLEVWSDYVLVVKDEPLTSS